MQYLVVFQVVVFGAVAGLHAYWALGGQAGLAAALPAHPGGQVVLRPSMPMVWLVVAVLLALALLSAAPWWLAPAQPPRAWRLATGAVAAGLLLRSVGDFRYVGFTKRVRHTTFARLDTRYYTPLCLLLAASEATLALAG